MSGHTSWAVTKAKRLAQLLREPPPEPLALPPMLHGAHESGEVAENSSYEPRHAGASLDPKEAP